MIRHILISRTDAIGDVVLTLPLCGLIKQFIPTAKISFLGNSYTKELIDACAYVDNFVNYSDWRNDDFAVQQLKTLNIDAIIHVFPKKRIASLASKAGIPTRIGTRNRIYHWIYCNSLIKLSRKKSELHEAQLNIKLLKGLGIEIELDLPEIQKHYGLQPKTRLDEGIENLLSKDKFNLIVHPKSAGSAREWSLNRYAELINSLDPQQFQIFITGSTKEKTCLDPWIQGLKDRVIDLTGKFSLAQLLTFVSKADGLVAASTGPVHLAAASGINALGLYPNSSSINAQRWRPIGVKATYIQAEVEDIDAINPAIVLEKIKHWQK
ncbi:glycosyltransferase family 9 protein [Desertivirga arenae]|uniref:glycosyltransferase family 9 protein n=1 Tax=Desertivirga arenae TaxID=2810309 RepID=UPI001F601437|nr:glycosyltransferase family 9 protein [Pedobacter sp. SYSU D00823]